ncbi:signal recognition particle-docking protein FtsY [Sinorhizobium saheli]|uniref:Signal recognition particle receptor FtsY n=1 Tax=Sinorhizobium saheli TaxID=36856 RepID=A0A178YTE8_SINSA|nr:signal recognition particle-docking protein FtsY [Sinorhizobium saheli]MQW86631.1 signal recognition particle-docking protein FtsY [Sinorhizobium saheli]OAP50025.1 signal recognition particle-docking protein FtsY [Sinorhizobium saheli]
MAIGFIKKIFSFGKDAVEEKPVPPQEVAPEVREEAPIPPSVPSGDLPFKGGEQRATEPAAKGDLATSAEESVRADDLAASPEWAAPESETSSEDASESTAPAADATVGVADESAPPPISPPVGEMPGRAEGGEAASERSALLGEAPPPPSVPSGHLPHKGKEQEEAEAAALDDGAAAWEAEAGAHERAASPEAITQDAPELAAPETEATREAPDARADVVANETVSANNESAPLSVSPLVGEMPGRAEGAETPGGLPAAPAPSLPTGFATADKRPKEEAPAAEPKLNWYQRLRRGLARTSSQLTGQIASLFTKRKLDEATLQDLEDLLIQADLGVETAMRITDTLASERYGKDVSGEDVSRIMAGEITKVLAPVARPLELDLSHKPHVILVVGVNGTGKTTTIGKLAAKLSGAGLKVMLAAGDTFRAAAIEQLKIWAERTKSDIVSSKLGADAAGLAYEAFQLAREKKSDVLIIDTAGRLQNKAELMAELEKIVRVLGKLDPDAPHTVLQTLDATTGQNALQQVEIFRNVAGVSGLIMTKLDGTARGGILVAISAKHKLPVYFIGVGEGIDDLEPFEAKDFAEAIAGVAAA